MDGRADSRDADPFPREEERPLNRASKFVPSHRIVPPGTFSRATSQRLDSKWQLSNRDIATLSQRGRSLDVRLPVRAGNTMGLHKHME